MVTVGGTDVWLGSELERLIAAPPVGAAPLSSTLHPSNLAKEAGVTVNVAVGLRSPYDAVIVPGVLLATLDVLMSNVATVLFTSRGALGGTCTAAGLLLESVAFTTPAE